LQVSRSVGGGIKDHDPQISRTMHQRRSEQLLCSADVMGNRAVTFQHPDWRGGFDLDLEKGAKTRRGFLERCASEGALVSSYHLPFPGLGHVARAGAAFTWIPVDWQWEGVSPT
jgi:hypothetical protein